MRYIKTYEQKVNLSDLVVDLDDTALLSSEPSDAKFKVGDYVIHKYNKYPYKIMYYYYHPLDRKLKCFVSMNHFTSKFWVNEDELRLATPEEIEEFKLKLNANKYNI